MIIFHEGLPGSGKSYEAAIKRIIPALKKGRSVFARINGLNYEMFSEITGIPLEQLKGHVELKEIQLNDRKNHDYVIEQDGKYHQQEFKGLLFHIEESQVLRVYNHVKNDSLVILDELQDFFPASQRKLDDEITKFVTQHRHRGIDIVCMGQDHRDCHNLWKRRIDQLITFTKRDAVGMPDTYTWTTYKQRSGKFDKLRSGKGKYDSKYFGLYKSHADQTDNKDDYEDDRVNIFKGAAFQFYVPVFACIFMFSVYYLYQFFQPKAQDQLNEQIVDNDTASIQMANQISNLSETPQDIQPKPNLNGSYTEEEYIQTIADQYRPRLAAFIHNEHKTVGRIEFLDDSFHAKESLTLRQIVAFGFSYEVKHYGILLKKGTYQIVATAWPLDINGRVSERVRESL